jgi:Bacterial Ig-like domain (group 3)
VKHGGTSQWVVGCFAWPWALGRVKFVQSVGVTLSQDGSAYSTRTSGPIPTTTTLTASPNPAEAGATVTLTATVSAADGVPPGEVEFAAGNTFIAIVPLDARGVATTTTTFMAPGPDPGTVTLSAFLLNSGPSYAGSSGHYDETVTPAGS